MPRRQTMPTELHGSYAEPLLEVANLRVRFETPNGTVNAVNGIGYNLAERERLVILGESGSGKTVGAEAVMGILPSPPATISADRLRFEGQDLLKLSAAKRRRIRGEQMAMVFQDALTALNPAFTVGDQIAEMYREHRGVSRRLARKRAIEMLDRVHIPSAASRVNHYPHQFSGGMRQRVMIAMALALDPKILIADEPTTALDVTVQAQILELLSEIAEESRMALILITHDLGVAAEIADRILVMYAGRVVEEGTTRDVFRDAAHPYTMGLMESMPRSDIKRDRLTAIGGSPPNLAKIPAGCAFHPRCPHVIDRCLVDRPRLESVATGHAAACHRTEELRREG